MLNEKLESIIRRCPEQYLWTYNRYKQPAALKASARARDIAPT
jgi:KDO2-lipid IV(A) lauroyltransferase